MAANKQLAMKVERNVYIDAEMDLRDSEIPEDSGYTTELLRIFVDRDGSLCAEFASSSQVHTVFIVNQDEIPQLAHFLNKIVTDQQQINRKAPSQKGQKT